MYVKPLEEVKEKWATVTPARSAYYESGVKGTPKDWAKQTSAAESAYESGVTAAIGAKRFGKGVLRVGDAKWRSRTIDVGVPRWGAGVVAAKDLYAEGWAPFHAELQKITLPAKGPRGDVTNIERVKKIAVALHKKRLEFLK